MSVLNTASEQLEIMISDTVTSTHQVVVTAQEIAANSQTLLQTMHGVAGVSEETATITEQGQTSLAHLEATMQTMETTAHTLADTLAVIQQRTKAIEPVILTITRMAAQTHLLSLNASLEAACTGQYGHGFAVVAQEVGY